MSTYKLRPNDHGECYCDGCDYSPVETVPAPQRDFSQTSSPVIERNLCAFCYETLDGDMNAKLNVLRRLIVEDLKKV